MGSVVGVSAVDTTTPEITTKIPTVLTCSDLVSSHVILIVEVLRATE